MPHIARTLVFLLPIAGCFPAHGQEGSPPVRLFEPYGRGTMTAVVDTPVTDTVATRPLGATGRVQVEADPRIARLMQDYRDMPGPQQGYRVQIFLGDRRTAEETKRAFLQKYPDVPAYLSWLAPNFRLRVGDLRTRLEAERFLQELKVSHPGSYIVPDEIEPPRVP